MDNPGFSLFSKPNCNRSAEYHSFVSEELEAEEDELRRNEEVNKPYIIIYLQTINPNSNTTNTGPLQIKEMMQNAFDDLDDDCHSINSSSYLASLSGM